MSDPETIVATIELTRDTLGLAHANLLDEAVRSKSVLGTDNDPNPFFGLREPIDLLRWREQIGLQ